MAQAVLTQGAFRVAFGGLLLTFVEHFAAHLDEHLMGLARCARFARCRGAAVSPWARQVNIQFDAARRGLTSVPSVLQIVAEQKPPAGFAEQRNLACLGVPGFGVGGEAVSEEENSTIEAMIVSMMALTPSERYFVDLKSS